MIMKLCEVYDRNCVWNETQIVRCKCFKLLGDVNKFNYPKAKTKHERYVLNFVVVVDF